MSDSHAPSFTRLIEDCLTRDQPRLLARVRGLVRGHRTDRPDPATAALKRAIESSTASRRKRAEQRPRISYPDLPIIEHREAIHTALRDRQVVVVSGETGSGKSTQLPKLCLEAGRGIAGMIGLTQPRRIAARRIAARLAEELHTPLGEGVGYTVRFNDCSGPGTYVKVMTDGILLAETQSDRALAEYDTIIIDEAHERSLNIDFLIGYVHRLLVSRLDLRVVISSATIDADRFAAHFDEAPIIAVSGRTHPVEVRYQPPRGRDLDETGGPMQRALMEAVDEALAEGQGDLLIFLSGEREIRATAKALRRHRSRVEILPLYARLPSTEQQRVFEPSATRRIVLTTNVAETSLTVPGIRYVIDPGLARVSRYSARSRIQRLPIEPVSQASARQRAGRCGRLGPGVCIRLYDAEDFEAREAYTPPEIMRANLAQVILRMRGLRLGEVRSFPFLEHPPRVMVDEGLTTLRELGALDERGELTPIGGQLTRLPIDPRLGRMLLAATHEGCLDPVLTIVASLANSDPRERPADRVAAADEAHAHFADERSDFTALLNIWRAYHECKRRSSWSAVRSWCVESYLSFVRMREWTDIRRQLVDLMRQIGHPVEHGPIDDDAVHRSLLSGLLANVGMRRDTREYEGPRGGRIHVFPGSGLFKKPPSWIMAAEIVDTTRRYARTVARIDPAWIEQVGDHLVTRTHRDPSFEPRSGRVVAIERVRYGGLELSDRRRVPYGPIDPAAARAVFISEALVGDRLRTRAEFARCNRTLIKSLETLEAKRRRHDLLADEATRAGFFDRQLPDGIWGARAFERWLARERLERPRILQFRREDLLSADCEVDLPDDIRLGGVRLKVTYRFDPGTDEDGATVTVPLPLLARLPLERIAWGLPAWLEETVTTLIRLLPKDLRRRFVPVPEVARLCVERLEFGRGNLPEALTDTLAACRGHAVPIEAWRLDALPDYLRIRIRLTDEDGREVDASRDVAALLERHTIAARHAFARLGEGAYDRGGITTWDFGELAAEITLPNGLTAYPSLRDDGDSVALTLCATSGGAEASMRPALRRLVLLAMPDELHGFLDWMPGLSQLELLHAPWGGSDALRADLLAVTADRAYLTNELPRTEEAFAACLAAGREQVWPHAQAVMTLAERILHGHQRVRMAMETLTATPFAEAIAEIKTHVDRLLPRRFLSGTPSAWLEHLPRYLQALEARLGKLRGGTGDDRRRSAELRPHWARWAERQRDHLERGTSDPQLDHYRWMLEEMHVSVFAQSLGTAVPVSMKRLEEQWSRMG